MHTYATGSPSRQTESEVTFEDIDLSWVSAALREEAEFRDHLSQLKSLRAIPTERVKRRPVAKERWD
eukprot:123333-Amphidinium_carterae.1